MKKLIVFLNLTILCLSQLKSTSAAALNNVKVDGLHENSWSKLTFNNGFKQREPNPLANATVKTEFKSGFDSENVYFLIKSYQNQNKIVTQVGKRDQSNDNVDNISIYIDPLNDETSGYRFSINPSNIQYDARIYDNGRMDEDWDAIWESATQINEDHWIAEIKIPLKSIKFQSKEKQTWGLNVGRHYKSNNEEIYWAQVDPTKGFKVSNFGKLYDLTNLKRSSDIIITPSVVGTFNSASNYDPTENRLAAFDLRYNVDQQHSIIATIKPDFAQIEADEDVINFTEYPDDLREKRPFFLEGNELYSMNDEVYYSRRMTSPDAGLKLIGSSGKFKYGLTYVRNNAQSEVNDKLISHKEAFILPVVRYVDGNTLDLAYINGTVNSEYEYKGTLHAFNARYSPNDHITFISLLAKTNLKENSISDKSDFNSDNHSARVQVSYNYSDYSGRVRLQKKTVGFEQGMIGEWERNNATELDYSVWKVIRLNNKSLRSIDLGFTNFHLATYDNNTQSSSHSLRLYFNIADEALGAMQIGGSLFQQRGDFRHRDFDEVLNTKRIHTDNFGNFIGEKNEYTGYNVRFRSDFSKPFGLRFFHQKRGFRQSERFDNRASIQYRPSNVVKFSLSMNYTDLLGSTFVEKAVYKSFGLKSQISFSDRIHLKMYNQFNSQSKDLSNNVVVSYEYLRGSFIYAAYSEIGSLKSDYNEGLILNDYRLQERTISLKWTHSLNL